MQGNAKMLPENYYLISTAENQQTTNETCNISQSIGSGISGQMKMV